MTRSELGDALDLFPGGGEMGDLVRSHGWTSCPLGPPGTWPQALVAVVGLVLDSDFPMFVAWGDELTFLYNDPYAKILGAKHPSALGRPFYEIWAEIWIDIFPLIDAALAGQATYRDNLPLLMNRNGYEEQTWFTFSYSPVRGFDGRVAGMFCACTETTAQVLGARRRDVLLDLDDRLRNVAETADVSFVASELLGGVLGASRVGYGEVDAEAGTIAVERNWSAPGFADVAGLHNFADYGTYMDDLRRGEAVANADVRLDARTSANADAFLALGIRAHLDVPVVEGGRTVAELFVHSQHPRRWTEEEIAFIRDFAKRTHAAIARRAAEAAMRASETRLREMNDTLEAQVAERAAERDRLWTLSQDMLAWADYSAMMSAVSPAWTEVLGWSESELLERPYASFMHPDDIPPTLEAIGRMAKTRRPTRFENRIATSLGGWKHIEWTVAPEADGMSFVAVGRDLSESKAREAELQLAQEGLRQSQKMEAMGSLTGGVAHDFNNLLAPIIGSLDMLVRKGIGSERERQLIDGALQSAERAKTLVQRLLAFARRQPLQATSVDVAQLVDSMRGLISSTIGPTIDVRVHVPASLPTALADPNQLEMALLNLAVNARDAMPKGGELTIAVAHQAAAMEGPASLKPGQYVRISVTDTGEGMDESTLCRAVEPFFSTKGIGKGTGLGLSMVHGLTAQLGGGLTINSAPGCGTTVNLWLPISHLPVDRDGASGEPVRAPSTLGRVLLVDDEDLVRLSTASMLMDLGYEVVEAASATEALRLVDDGLVLDLLVTDHLMPGLTGLELVHQLRRARPDLPVLIVSGYAEAEGIDPALPRLIKPFRNADLLAHLAAIEVRTVDAKR